MNHLEQDAEALLSDSDIMDIVLEREAQMIEAVDDWVRGLTNLLIVRGPAGIGKTETITRMTQEAGVVSTDIVSSTWAEPDDGRTYPWDLAEEVKVKGALIRGADYSNWALFADLYANRDEGMLVLDDNDSILKEEVGAALIMKASEQQVERAMSFTKAAKIHELLLRDVPPTFKTKCRIAILTNHDIKFSCRVADEQQRTKGKLPPSYVKRWKAMLSRGAYIDMELNTPRAVRIYCEHKITSAKILTHSAFLESRFKRSLTATEAKDVMKWIRFNQSKLSEPLDLRTYNKVAALMLDRKKDWEASAARRVLRIV